MSSSPYEKNSPSFDSAKPIGFWQGATLQLVNPKAWLMSLGAVTSFSLDGPSFLLSFTSINFAMLLVNCIAGFIWLAFGRAIGQWLTSPTAWRRFNLIMGSLTVLSVIFVWI